MRFLMTVLLSVLMASGAAFAGEIKIERASSLETPEGMPTAGVFMIVTNTGDADRILSAKTDAAEKTMLHTMDVDEKTGVIVMKHVEAFDVPANGSLALAPAGNHVMLGGMKKPLKKGETFPMTLVFEKAGEKKIDVEVVAASDMNDRFPAALSSALFEKVTTVNKNLGKEPTDEQKSVLDRLRERIQNLFRKEKATEEANAEAGQQPILSREELENRLKMEAMSRGDTGHEGHGMSVPTPEAAATDATPPPPAPIATDAVDPNVTGPVLEPQKAVIPPAPTPAPAAIPAIPAPDAAPKP